MTLLESMRDVKEPDLRSKLWVRFLSPPWRRGRRAELNNVTLPQNSARRGRSDACFVEEVFDLPAPRRVAKVALLLLDRRGVPSSKEGIKTTFKLDT
jgi:hypothetical protein